ncbi:MAG TPA: GNAT family protein [Allosphingosinicella sp.]|nr:GNAT family protein [Allosphingosinicella sp.]
MPDSKRKPPSRPRSPTRPTPKPKASKPRPDLAKVTAAEVELVPTKGTPGKGGGPGGHAWVIRAAGKRAGVIYINWIDEAPVGKHASIQIYLNQSSQGRGVGRIAYRLASEASQYDVVYAHMRKINVASRRAAEEAGYVDAGLPTNQLIMKWTRKRS